MQLSPGGATASVRVIVPVNPLIGATVMVEAADTPAVVLTVVGLAATEKSVKVKVKTAEFVMDPSVPVTVTE